MSDTAAVSRAPAAHLGASPSVSRWWQTEDWIAVVLGFLVISASSCCST